MHACAREWARVGSLRLYMGGRRKRVSHIMVGRDPFLGLKIRLLPVGIESSGIKSPGNGRRKNWDFLFFSLFLSLRTADLWENVSCRGKDWPMVRYINRAEDLGNGAKTLCLVYIWSDRYFSRSDPGANLFFIQNLFRIVFFASHYCSRKNCFKRAFSKRKKSFKSFLLSQEKKDFLLKLCAPPDRFPIAKSESKSEEAT